MSPAIDDPMRLRLSAARLVVVGMVTVVAASLCACSTTTARRNPEPVVRSSSAATPNAGPSTAAPPKKSGGYYLDDGPGENPPANLDLVPDAVPKIEKYASGANRPYNVFGVDYVPDLSGAAYKQRGVGSWYGRKFHGQRTSSGEIYDMYAMTAAHPTLPIPSYALVTNLSNGKSIIVRVNDRGPFLFHRVMDLSYAAALKLGYLSSGSGTIEVELLMPADIAAGRIPVTSNSLFIASASAAGRKLDPGATVSVVSAPAKIPTVASAATITAVPTTSSSDATPPASAPTAVVPLLATATDTLPSVPLATSIDAARGIPADLIPTIDPQSAPVLPASASSAGYYLQLGAFRVRAGADSFASHVTREIDPAIASKVQVWDNNGLYRVRVGPYPQRADADSAASSLRAAIAQPVLVMPSVPATR